MQSSNSGGASDTSNNNNNLPTSSAPPFYDNSPTISAPPFYDDTAPVKFSTSNKSNMADKDMDNPRRYLIFRRAPSDLHDLYILLPLVGSLLTSHMLSDFWLPFVQIFLHFGRPRALRFSPPSLVKLTLDSVGTHSVHKPITRCIKTPRAWPRQR
jgi:hypothetical protein